VPVALLASFLGVLEVFRIGLTQPSFRNMLVVVWGWLQTQGPHAVTEALLRAKVAGRRHHAAFHRFFSRSRWDPDCLGYWIFRRLECFTDQGMLQVVIDDTITPKKGPHVFGLGSHVDPVRSTRRHRIFCFGHCWVVLAVLVRVPLSNRIWALPVLFRLYRNKKETAENQGGYAKKTELAREMIDVFMEWVGDRRVEVALDAAYCNETVTRGLPGSVVLFGAMRTDAVLTAAPETRPQGAKGRPRLRGDLLPKPQQIARDGRRPWRTVEAFLYGQRRTVRYKTLYAQWYRACGVGLLRVVVVATDHGQVPFRVFFCTDAGVDVVRVLETYAGRWGVEVFFREAKQLLGFADSSARTENAVRRVAPFVGLLYTTLVVWFLESHAHSFLAFVPLRPWYAHKTGLCFADILRTARVVLGTQDILDLVSNSNNFALPTPPASLAGPTAERLPA
jgi:DDE superfamily endonuclease